MAPPPPHLMEELVEEILLRFPPDDPASLVHATLVCKLWCRLVCGAAFRRRFREFHRRALPILGLLYGDSCRIRHDDTPREDTMINLVNIHRVPIAKFVPTTSFRPAHTANGCYSWSAIDARHGRILLCRHDRRLCNTHGDLCVLDPITAEQRDLPKPPFYLHIASVACAATTGGDCDHLDCRQGPFLVVAMNIQYDGMQLSMYSSEDGAWSKITFCQGPAGANSHINFMYNNLPGVLVRSALYILVHYNQHDYIQRHDEIIVNHEIVKYDMATRQLSMIRLPSKFRRWEQSIVVITDDDGGMGFVVNVKNKLQIWSKVADADGDAGFVLTKAIDLWKVLPSGALKKKMQPQVNGFADGGDRRKKKKVQPQVNGFADGGDRRVLFIRTSDALYGIEINFSQVTRVAHSCGNGKVVPYISFCTPTSKLQH